MEIRSAQADDAVRVQELRKIGWQDNYVHPETGVTKEILRDELAKLPVPDSDIQYYLATLSSPENGKFNLVAVDDSGEVVGTIFYEQLKSGNGDIGVFVDREHRGKGIGSALLEALIARTSNDLEVTIFARNKSRKLYKKFGFVEEGDEGMHTFREGVSLPIQRLVLRRIK